MSTAVDRYPPFGLHVVAGPLELRGLTDELLMELCDVAEAGIHHPDEMPFYFPWSSAPVGQLGRNTAAYHWGKRATFTPEDFCLDLAVLLDGRVIGAQGVAAKHFPVTRTGETGSWLGREFQGRGLGTEMRRAFCALCTACVAIIRSWIVSRTASAVATHQSRGVADALWRARVDTRCR